MGASIALSPSMVVLAAANFGGPAGMLAFQYFDSRRLSPDVRLGLACFSTPS